MMSLCKHHILTSSTLSFWYVLALSHLVTQRRLRTQSENSALNYKRVHTHTHCHTACTHSHSHTHTHTHAHTHCHTACTHSHSHTPRLAHACIEGCQLFLTSPPPMYPRRPFLPLSLFLSRARSLYHHFRPFHDDSYVHIQTHARGAYLDPRQMKPDGGRTLLHESFFLQHGKEMLPDEYATSWEVLTGGASLIN